MKHRIINHFLSLFCLSLLLVSGCTNSEQADTLQQVTEHVVVDADLLEALKQDLRDFEEALHIIRKGAGRFDDVVAYIDTQRESRLADWKKAAEQGIPEGQILFGYSFLYVPGGDALNAEAAKWFRKAAELGHPEGQYRLATYYSISSRAGPPLSFRGLVDWFRTSAKEKYAKSLDWYKKAGEQGHVQALYTLGNSYRQGHDRAGVPADPDEAEKWIRKAAELGHAESQFHVGMNYLNEVVFHNPVTPASIEQYQQDSAEGMAWVRKAAEQGHARAQYWLGMSYYQGMQLPQDTEEAMKWLHKAAEQGDTSADRLLMQILRIRSSALLISSNCK